MMFIFKSMFAKSISVVLLTIVSTSVFANDKKIACTVNPTVNGYSVKITEYSGNCKDGYADGKGVVKWYFQGGYGRYEGEFSRGRIHGIGKAYYVEGTTDYGRWHENRIHTKLVEPVKETVNSVQSTATHAPNVPIINDNYISDYMAGKLSDRKYIRGGHTTITDADGKTCSAKFSRITGLAGYPFDSPESNTLVAKPIYNDDRCYHNSYTGWEWSNAYALYRNNKLFAVSYYAGDNNATNNVEVDKLKTYGSQFCTNEYYRCYVFVDNEVWGLKWENPRLNPYKLRGTDEYNIRKKQEAKREAEAEKQRQIAYNKKVANFRKNLKVGDDASAGIVIEIKGNLVKIQTNDRQCTQRDYRGNCGNYINTPVEKWVKRSELYPAD